VMATTPNDTSTAIHEAEAAVTEAAHETAKATLSATQLFKDSAAKLGKEAVDRAKTYAEDGKARAGGALDEIVKMINDAAGTVDDKLGEQYGQYA
ncbi:hypothetical protein, partial [Pseudomonas sp. MPR-R2A5]|uniref:hypothetical protein n=1 Tax=Pseudomonas sp. MPR-R2A5 TaxID=2070622 RepID=UPI0021148ADB